MILQKRVRLTAALMALSLRPSCAFLSGHEVPSYTRWLRLQSSISDVAVISASEVVATSPVLGGDLYRIYMEGEEDGFAAKMGVPTFATKPRTSISNFDSNRPHDPSLPEPTRKGLEALVPGAFVLKDALPSKDCEEIIRVCEHGLKFGEFNAGRNSHGALQLLVSDCVSDGIARILRSHIDLYVLYKLQDGAKDFGEFKQDVRYTIAGVNKRWRVYRYAPNGCDQFSPHIDAGFPPSSLSNDGTQLIWDSTKEGGSCMGEIVSRLTVLMYLNDDFSGGETNFFHPRSELDGDVLELLASVKPEQGSILVFPQAVGEDAVEYARQRWPLHEGSPVTGGSRPKYVIRSDVLFATTFGISPTEKEIPEQVGII